MANEKPNNTDKTDGLTDLESEFQTKVQAMQLKFKEGLPARLAEIFETWDRAQSSTNSLDDLLVLHRLVHSLTGSSGTFSCHNLSVEARILEIFLKGLIEEEQPLSSDVTLQMTMMLKELKKASLVNEEVEATYVVPTIANKSLSQPLNKVLIIDDDGEFNEYLITQLMHFGYEVESVCDLSKVVEKIEQFSPNIIVCDIIFPEGDLAGIAVVSALSKELQEHHIPIIFISSRQDVKARLEAVRANGIAYFTKPINISALVNKISEVSELSDVEPYHVLVVDDDPSLVDLTVFILKSAGMDAHGITNPLDTLEEISLNKPDLVLMDVHMPACSGIEMAQVIRQQSSLSGIPIIFLSSEADTEVQFQAVLEGGDEFLAKPVNVQKLPVLIQSKAKRAREMSALMIRDGLTGLYNHTYIKEVINTELERSRRSGIEVSIAMMDIDFFKKVNDTYGHMVGDQVLRSLSHFLLKRLRKTDKIGRYGGEEFVVVLIDTPLDKAIELMNAVLKSFREIKHQAEDIEFNVTFSCGVISSNMTTDANVLTNAMDQALYKAKKAGRNQIILADLDNIEI